MAPLRVLYLQPASSFGGAERQAAQCIRLLPEHNVEVVPVLGPGREILDFLDDAGVQHYLFRADLPRDVKAPRGLRARADLWSNYVRSFFQLTRDLANEAISRRCALLFASRPFAWVVASVVGARIDRPVVWRAGTNFEHWSQPLALELFAAHRPPRGVIYTSAAIQRTIGSAVLAPSFVIHNGVDTERFSPTRAVESLRGELGLLPNAPTVGLVARIAPEKGPELFVDVCRRLRGRVPGVRVLVAGDSGWRAKFERQCREAQLDGTIRFLGFRRDVERVYATCDVVISTSIDEGCPNALLEAMAMGRAVVATRVGGTEEIVVDGAHGHLVARGDADRFAERVVQLLSDTAHRAQIGAHAAEHVREHFSVDAQVRRLSRVLHWAADHERPQPAMHDAPAPSIIGND